METFTLSRKELHRPGLLKALCGGRLTNAQVAAALRITVRQVRRLKRRFEAGGPGALVHGNRDRPSPRRLPAVVRDAVVRLMTTVYVGFNDTHLTEKLREHHALGISRETVRRYREQLGHPPKRARRAPRVRRRRVPSAARGALIQIDGSPFPWLEDRGPELMLLGAIDDATSEILALQFRPAEDVHGYVTLFRDVFTAHGLPMAVYGDRLNLLVRNHAHWSVEEQLAGTQAPTHVGRILQNLAIGYPAARRRRPAPRSSSIHSARGAPTANRVASVALGRCRSACHGSPPTRTLAVDRSPPIPGGARRRPRFGCMKHEPGGRFHVAATEDLITEQRHSHYASVSLGQQVFSQQVLNRVLLPDPPLECDATGAGDLEAVAVRPLAKARVRGERSVPAVRVRATTFCKGFRSS